MLERNPAEQEAQQQANNQTIMLSVGVLDSLTITAIFTMFLSAVMRKALEETWRFVLFPLAACNAVIEASLAWRQARLERGKNGTKEKAVVETIAALGIGTAVVGTFVAASVFALAAPIIFSAIMGFKTLFHLGSAGYYLGKSAATKDPVKKNQYRQVAYANAVGAVALVLASVAVSLVMIALKPIMGILGVVAGAISATSCVYHLYKLRKNKVSVNPAPLLENKKITASDAPKLSVSARLYKFFRPSPTPAPTVHAVAVENKLPTTAIHFLRRTKPIDIHAQRETRRRVFSRSI